MLGKSRDFLWAAILDFFRGRNAIENEGIYFQFVTGLNPLSVNYVGENLEVYVGIR